MSNTVLIANIELWRFFLVVGIWKCRRMITSSEAQAPAYVDLCHRSALFYSFACLVLAEFARLSCWPPGVNVVTVITAINVFTTVALACVLKVAFKMSPEAPNLGAACNTRSSSALCAMAHLLHVTGRPQPN